MSSVDRIAHGAGEAAKEDTRHWRPTLHFTPQDTWMNDPNGLITHHGVHHLFFQNNPWGRHWGNMSWGHAVSQDRVTWQELPVAIHGDAGEGIFSGSVVWDRNNTSGLGTDGDGPLVALYTSAYTEHAARGIGQAQSLAWSLDAGMTWQKHPGNPVLDRGTTDFRDPKVFWHDESGQWVMVCVEALDRQVLFHTSPDLVHWSPTGTFGPAGATEGIWECPDLVRVPVEGTSESRWVLLVSINPGGPAGGSGMQWFPGTFDGLRFVADEPSRVRWFDFGPDMYAGVSFSGAADEVAVVGWMSNWSYASDSPTRPWASAMTLVRTLTLVRDGDDLLLRQRPILPAGWTHVAASDTPVVGASPVRLSGQLPEGASLDLVRSTGATGSSLRLRRSGNLVQIDRGAASSSALHQGFEVASAEVHEGPVELELIEDHGLVEVYLGGGVTTLCLQTFPVDGPMTLHATGWSPRVEYLTAGPEARRPG